MTEDYKAKLRALLEAYAERAAKVQPADKTPQDQADRRKTALAVERAELVAVLAVAVA